MSTAPPAGRRSLVVGVAVAAVLAAGAAAAFFLLRGDGPSPLLSGLDAAHTGGAVNVLSLHELAALAVERLDALPDPVRAEMKLPARGKLADVLGFDPTVADGWQVVGVDPEPGLAIVFDTRIVAVDVRKPAPVFLARVTSREALRAFVEKRSGSKVVLGAESGGIQDVTVGGRTGWLGARGDVTALLVPEADDVQVRTALRNAFAAFLQAGAARLGESDGFRTAMAGARSPYFLGYANVGAIGAAVGGSDQPDVGFYAGLFPYLGAHAGKTTAWRLVTSEAGHAALAKVVEPAQAPPACAALLPKQGWAATRVSVNLAQLFEGVGLLLPPSLPTAARMQVAAAPALLGVATGVTWDQLAGALTGHACAGVDVQGAAAAAATRTVPQWLGVVGVRDEAKADALLVKLAGLAKAAATVTEAPVAGGKGYAATLGPMTVAVVRRGDRILVGSSAAVVQAAVERSAGDSLAATPVAEGLDGKVALGWALDLKPILEAAKASMGPGRAGGAEMALVDAVTRDIEQYRYVGAMLRLRPDALELASTGSDVAGGTAAAVGMVAALAIPAFLRFKERAEEVKARMHEREEAMRKIELEAEAPAPDPAAPAGP